MDTCDKSCEKLFTQIDLYFIFSLREFNDLFFHLKHFLS